MAIVAITSAKGAPGVSTTALAMALAWPRPVMLLEADAAGSSSFLAGYLQGQTRHDVGLVDVAMAHRDGDLLTSIHHSSIALPGKHARIVPGLTSPVQAKTVAPVWEAIAAALRKLERQGTDVIIDAGRMGTLGGPQPLLRTSDAVLLATRTNLPAIAAARVVAPLLAEDLQGRGLGPDVLSLLLIGQGKPYTAQELTAAIRLPVTASIAFDPDNAAAISLGAPPPRRFQRSAFVRSINAANSALGHQLVERRTRLATTSRRPSEATHA